MIIDLSKIKLCEGKEDLYVTCFENINVHVKYKSIYGNKL